MALSYPMIKINDCFRLDLNNGKLVVTFNRASYTPHHDELHFDLFGSVRFQESSFKNGSEGEGDVLTMCCSIAI